MVVLEQKLERYFVASGGAGFAAVWSLAGFTSALVCLVAGAACFGAAIVYQRGLLRRFIEAARERQTRQAAKRPAASRDSVATTRLASRMETQAVEAADPESREALSVQYGW
jgi:hypothetical protein